MVADSAPVAKITKEWTQHSPHSDPLSRANAGIGFGDGDAGQGAKVAGVEGVESTALLFGGGGNEAVEDADAVRETMGQEVVHSFLHRRF